MHCLWIFLLGFLAFPAAVVVTIVALGMFLPPIPPDVPRRIGPPY